jgi:Flp pilus assembly protein TadG
MTGMARIRNAVIANQRSEEGASLVEMALVFAFIVCPILFGIFEFSIALYAYNFVNVAARQATRYASVRGVESCIIAAPAQFPDCNVNPAGSSYPTSTSGTTTLQTYVRNLAYPGINTNNLTVTATWLSKQVNNGVTTWSNAAPSTCGGASAPYTDAYGQPCNTPGDAVQVYVTYPISLGIPFWKGASLTLTASSQMVINE